jgi:hypothetical protein
MLLKNGAVRYQKVIYLLCNCTSFVKRSVYQVTGQRLAQYVACMQAKD